MSKIENIQVKITKMSESSGNKQFFVRMVRTDTSGRDSLAGMLEYQCFQTKHTPIEDCLQNAWFAASLLARFVGLSSMDEVIIENVTPEEKEILIKSLALRF